jgi:hypothetical protein
MNQPKFKFGDKVWHMDRDASPFVIEQIMHRGGSYLYSSTSGSLYTEDAIELYQEPQKKKLYAYQWDTFRTGKNTSRMIAFFECESLIAERRPEYDIEFPSP